MTATPIGSARVVFVDQNGAPLVGGSVAFLIPGTLTKKATWADPAQTMLNANPITLDGLGSASVWGVGAYRQIVKDATGVLIWDSETAAPAQYGSVDPSTLTAAIQAELATLPIQGLS